MADVAEGLVPPPAVDQSGNLTIWWVATIADVTAPKAATEIGAATSFRLTYSFTNDGWSFAASQAKTKDERLTLPQALEALGSRDISLNTLKYVDSAAAGSAKVVLAPTGGAAFKSGYFVERRNVPNTTLAAASQLVRVIPANVGLQLPGPTDGTGKFTILQEAAITGAIGPEVAMAA